MEVEAVDEGKITKILVKDGTTSVPVNSIIAILDGSDDLNDSIKNDEEQNTEKLNIKNSLSEFNETKNDDELLIDPNKKFTSKNNLNIKASPHAKYLAKKNNINLNIINGSGPDGRIIKRDLENIDIKLEKQNIQNVIY